MATAIKQGRLLSLFFPNFQKRLLVLSWSLLQQRLRISLAPLQLLGSAAGDITTCFQVHTSQHQEWLGDAEAFPPLRGRHKTMSHESKSGWCSLVLPATSFLLLCILILAQPAKPWHNKMGPFLFPLTAFKKKKIYISLRLCEGEGEK